MAKTTEKVIMNEAEVSRAIKRMAQEIIEKNKGAKDIALIGILEGGLPIAKRLAKLIASEEGADVPTGSMDVSLYRDDLSVRGKNITLKKSDIPFSVDNKVVILVDDVLFHGRTVRAALDNLNDYGRASKVQLAVIVDRGNRELPIQPDFFGKKIATSLDDKIKVSLAEIDGKDQVSIS